MSVPWQLHPFVSRTQWIFRVLSSGLVYNKIVNVTKVSLQEPPSPHPLFLRAYLNYTQLFMWTRDVEAILFQLQSWCNSIWQWITICCVALLIAAPHWFCFAALTTLLFSLNFRWTRSRKLSLTPWKSKYLSWFPVCLVNFFCPLLPNHILQLSDVQYWLFYQYPIPPYCATPNFRYRYQQIPIYAVLELTNYG